MISNAQYRYADRLSAKCRLAECRGAISNHLPFRMKILKRNILNFVVILGYFNQTASQT